MSGLLSGAAELGEGTSRDFYTQDSKTYDMQRWRSEAGAFTNRVQQRIVTHMTEAWGPDTVIEVGPGTGRFTIPLARAGRQLTVVDLSPGMLDVARENIAKTGMHASIDAFVEGSIYSLPFAACTFDHAMSLNVFNHLDRSGDALRELARVVRPGGSVLFNYANLRSYYFPAARRINRARTAVGQDVFSSWLSHGMVRTIVRDANLEIEQFIGHTHVPRALERLRLLPVIRALDTISRHGPLRGLAPVQFCLCRRISD